MIPKEKNLVLVFTRNPELGKVKTRLAKTLGDQAALDIYSFLLAHTEAILRPLNCDKAVYYSVKVRTNDIWDEQIYQKHQQYGEDLGLRMLQAFQKAFDQNYDKVIIVGSDLYDLTAKHIEEAFQQLDQHDVVFGPAQDGGYYLLGMKSLYSPVFKNKSWGEDRVLEDSLNDLKNQSVYQLEMLNDIDVFEDMKHIEVLKKYYNT